MSKYRTYDANTLKRACREFEERHCLSSEVFYAGYLADRSAAHPGIPRREQTEWASFYREWRELR